MQLNRYGYFLVVFASALAAGMLVYQYTPETAPAAPQPQSTAQRLAQQCEVSSYRSGSPDVKPLTSGATTILRFSSPPKRSLALRALENGEIKKISYLYGLYGPETLAFQTLLFPWPMAVEIDGTTTLLLPNGKCGQAVQK